MPDGTGCICLVTDYWAADESSIAVADVRQFRSISSEIDVLDARRFGSASAGGKMGIDRTWNDFQRRQIWFRYPSSVDFLWWLMAFRC